MKKIFLFILLCASVLVTQAQYKSKELAFNLKDGRSLFIAKNNNNKVGIIDNTDKVIIPFDFFSAMKVLNDKNAFFIVYPEMGSKMEVYNLSGEKIIDRSKGYDNLYNLPPSPGYIVSGSQGLGMLDVNLNEIIPPIYANVTAVLLGNYYILGTQKKHGEFYTISDKLMDSNWNSYTAPIEGSFTSLTNLIPISGSEIHIGDPSVSPQIRSISFIKLKSKAGTTPENKFMSDAIYFVVDSKDGNTYSKLNNCSIMIPNYKVESNGDTLIIKEIGSNDFFKFHNGKDNIIEFNFNGESYKMAPQLFSDSFKINYIHEKTLNNGDRTIIESNYSKSWLNELIGILNKF